MENDFKPSSDHTRQDFISSLIYSLTITMGDTFVSRFEDTEIDLTRYMQNSTKMVQNKLIW